MKFYQRIAHCVRAQDADGLASELFDWQSYLPPYVFVAVAPQSTDDSLILKLWHAETNVAGMFQKLTPYQVYIRPDLVEGIDVMVVGCRDDNRDTIEWLQGAILEAIQRESSI